MKQAHRISESLMPLHLPGLAGNNKSKLILAGDVGGTKTNLGVFEKEGTKLIRGASATYQSSAYESVIDILNEFCKTNQLIIDTVCLGVAGPVIDGKVELTNLSWDLDAQDIMDKLKISRVYLLNDLEATAYGLAGMQEEDFICIHEGKSSVGGNAAIVAPGTGLGEAGLYWDGSVYHPFPTEGGHCDFCPRSDLDIALLKYLQNLYGVVSWEKLISGPAIPDIYAFLLTHHNRVSSSEMIEQLRKKDKSAVISKSAIEQTDQTSVETMELFVRYLARESSNLVLKMKAVGGLFLGGGIPPKIAPLLQNKLFHAEFMDCDRMQHLLEEVSIRIIMNQKAPMMGAAYYGAFNDAD